MIPVILVNACIVALSMVLPNEVLAWHSYALYGTQLLTMIPYLLRRVVLLQHLFLPTIFALTYFLFSLTLGSYLVPRDYGWDKQFTAIALAAEHYNVIVPFLLLANVVLFILSDMGLRKLSQIPSQIEVVDGSGPGGGVGAVFKSSVCLSGFFAVYYFDVPWAFAFGLALVILHLADAGMKRRRFLRLASGVCYMALIAALSYDNKREIAMLLFLLIFLEAYHSRAVLRFSLTNTVAYALAACTFFALILAASIMRGYGDFPVVSVVDAVRFIPQYMTSELFIDGLADNLELNYHYGTAVTAMDYAMRSLIDYQYGESLIKVLFLPIPREALAFKPESAMQLFTSTYAPEWWLQGGSLPVMFAADMFINFHIVGLAPLALTWFGVNQLFVKLHAVNPRGFIASSCLFLSMTVLMLARGSGIELWLLYYLLAAPLFLFAKLMSNGLRQAWPRDARWVV